MNKQNIIRLARTKSNEIIKKVDDELIKQDFMILRDLITGFLNTYVTKLKKIYTQPYKEFESLYKELELDKYNGYVAGYNGGEILDMKTNKVLSRESLTREELLEIYEETKDIDLKFITYKNNFRLLELDNINDNNTLKCYKIS